MLAATGVGSGDLVTAALAGNKVGMALFWTPILGASLKYVLTESLARVQIGTEETLLFSWTHHLGHWIRWVFLGYLLIWSFMVGGALIGACAIAGDALFSFTHSKIFWGVFHSLLGFALVRFGKYDLLEKIMAGFVFVMFNSVILCSFFILFSHGDLVFQGFTFWPKTDATNYILGVMGGVGGTLTVVSYGYWMIEKKRKGKNGLLACRRDLAFSYALTGLFSFSMLIIGAYLRGVSFDKTSFALAVAGGFTQLFGPWGGKLFLIGFWATVFSSLLGVWQGVPYIFADFMQLTSKHRNRKKLEQTSHYLFFLIGLSIVPLISLKVKFVAVQMAYAVLGAFFMPILATTLLILGNKKSLLKKEFRNSMVENACLILTLGFFAYMTLNKLMKM